MALIGQNGGNGVAGGYANTFCGECPFKNLTFTSRVSLKVLTSTDLLIAETSLDVLRHPNLDTSEDQFTRSPKFCSPQHFHATGSHIYVYEDNYKCGELHRVEYIQVPQAKISL